MQKAFNIHYLLSNNHVNSIIVHKFDFSDEEIMAYYISFLKTLSLKLNNHTVHFFYNEHTNDFALYTEAIKFFNHPESMVRIAVRTITLNVYKVDNQHMLHYIRDKTAVPYFSNLVWFIGSHVIELDKCVQTDEEHKNRGKLSDLVAEHLDHLHYLNDILIINCEFLSDVLTDHLLNRLFLPLYVYSLVSPEQSEERKINPQVSLYLLSQVFLIIHYQPLVHSLADVILNGDLSVFTVQTEQSAHKSSSNAGVRRFTKPTESLERSLEMSRHRGKKRTQKRPNYKNVGEEEEEERGSEEGPEEEKEKAKEIEMVVMEKGRISELSTLTEQNITDEEKSAAAARSEGLKSRPFLDMLYNALDCDAEDYQALFVLCLLYAMSHSKGINLELLERIQLPVPNQERSSYSQVLVERVIRIMSQAAQPGTHTSTFSLYCTLQTDSKYNPSPGEEIFLDMFEDEYRCMMNKPLNVEYLMMDASILLPPTGTPLTGIDFLKRLPCGDVERTRRAIRMFFMLRSLSLQLQGEPETQLPLTRPEDLIKTDDVLDLNNSDLIACMVVSKDGVQAQRFLAVDVYQMSLVEPDSKRLGWGVVKFAGLLQDMQVSGVEDDSRALNIIIHKPTSNPHAKPVPILQANFIFADHIRCIIAKQRLAKGRIQARRMKMQRIAALLDLPVQPSTEVLGFSQPSVAASLPFRFYDQSRRGPAFASVDKVPGFAVAHISQHNPTSASSTSPASSGPTGASDPVTASNASAHTVTQSQTGLALAPSLTPARQPTISLLSDNDAETLSVDSLTLLPPAAPPRLRSFSTQSSVQDDASAEGEEMVVPSQKEDDDTGATDSQSQDDRKDISIIPEEDEPSPESGPLLSVETEDLTQNQRKEPVTQPETNSIGVAANLEDNPDLEEETAID
uniref:C-type lectin domain containing 16A n=1 Tax=Cyprinus carpio TaxID=7962 RepID=A0A8C1JW63_CYPCA